MQLSKLYELTEQGINIIKLVYPQVTESELECRQTEKYGEVYYVRGTDNKWYSPIDAYMISNQKTPGNKDEFKAAIKEIAHTLGLDDRGKEKKESDVDASEIAEIASKLLRIGGKWYKKAKDPLTKQEALFNIPSSIIVSDYGKDIGNLILKAAPKYLAETNIPSHINYRESIDNGDGELFYNIYRPLSHIPTEGEWKHIEMLLRHIFQEQYEMALDYIKILYEKPLHSLPILLLVSNETGTGKSTFCKFLNAVFCENALPLTPEIVESRFNSYWVGKLLGYIEEQADDSEERKAQNAKMKLVVTAEKLPSEGKGKDPKVAFNFLKVIICSNDEYTPVKIDPNDTRYWVRKVPALSKKEEGTDILDECVKEIPYFLKYLLDRQMRYERKNRLWFNPEEMHTDAWRKIVRHSEPSLEQELREILLDIMREQHLEMLEYDLTTLMALCEKLRLPSRLKCSITRSDLSQILQRWGIGKATKTATRITYYLRDDLDKPSYSRQKVGKKLKIYKKKLIEDDF